MKLTPRIHHHKYLNLREEIFQATTKMAGKRNELRRKEDQLIIQKIIN